MSDIKTKFEERPFANTLLLNAAICAAKSHRRDKIFVPTIPCDISILPNDASAITNAILNNEPINNQLLDFTTSVLSTGSCFELDYKAFDLTDENTNEKSASLEEFTVNTTDKSKIEFEARRKHAGSFFLFHGSPIENWYSILINGIKNCSDTEMMLNGAVYGSGVYLSSRLQMSQHYGSSREFKHKFFAIGVFEVLGKSQDYAKGASIFVVNDVSRMQLRYLILISNNTPNTIIDKLSDVLFDRFVVKAEQQRKELELRIDKRETRLENERIQCSKIGWSIETVNDTEYDVVIWRMHGIDESMIQILFPAEYPMEPPIVWDRLGAKKIREWTPLMRIKKVIENTLPMSNMENKSAKDFLNAVPKVKRGEWK